MDIVAIIILCKDLFFVLYFVTTTQNQYLEGSFDEFCGILCVGDIPVIVSWLDSE
jgi:uncharacterized membrane protein